MRPIKYFCANKTVNFFEICNPGNVMSKITKNSSTSTPKNVVRKKKTRHKTGENEIIFQLPTR